MRLARLTGRPFSITAHAYDIFMTPTNLREKLERADAVFTGCEYNVRHLRDTVPAANLHKVVMGVDAAAFERGTPLPQGRTVLAIGRLVEKKGFDVLLDAIAALPDVRLRIVGDGPLRGSLAEQAKRCGGRVELLGSRPPAEVRAELERADVLAMPCVVAADGDRDSMPVVVKEAMAMGLLVVASDEVGLPECVLAPWGFLAPPGDARALAAQLRAALALDAARRAGRPARGRAPSCRRMPTSTSRPRAWRAIVSRPSLRARRRRRSYRRGRRDEQPQPGAQRDRVPAGGHRPALLGRRLRREEAAPDDENVVAAAAQRVAGSARRCGYGREEAALELADELARRCRCASRRRAIRGTGRPPTSRRPARSAGRRGRSAAARRRRGRCRGSARR